MRCDCLNTFFYKKCFTFSRMQTLKTVKSIHSIVTRLLRYSHKNSTRCDCLSTYFLFYLIKRCLTFSKMQTLKTVKFIYSEKGTKFCEIFTLLLSYIVPVKSKVKISQNFVAFSEYMNFKKMDSHNICFLNFPLLF